MPQGAAPNAFQMLGFPFLMMFVVFYFLVFRPQSKAQKSHAEMLKNLRKEDEVVTTGGMFGTVVNVRTDTVTLRIDDKVRVEVEKPAIARLVKSRGAEPVAAVVEKSV